MHVTSGQIDRGGLLERQFDSRFVCRDQRANHTIDMPAGQVVRLERVNVEVETGFGGVDQGSDHALRKDLSQSHADERPQRDLDVGRPGFDP